ncbi:MAG: hypothetical protein ACKVW3_09535 [Phycisphaerales bacterium]
MPTLRLDSLRGTGLLTGGYFHLPLIGLALVAQASRLCVLRAILCVLRAIEVVPLNDFDAFSPTLIHAAR